MRSDRLQRHIDRLLDQCEEAITQRDWDTARELAEAVLRMDPENADARAYLVAAHPGGPPADPAAPAPGAPPTALPAQATPAPTSFANGRYEVTKFLGEGGKKKVYLAHDTLLDRDVAFALIKTEGLDEVGRERVRREAQAMGRLGAHPHIVSVFDLGEHEGQPYMVTELMGGGDVEGLIEKAPGHRVPLAEAIRIADEVCRGLEFAHEKQIVHRDLKPGNVWLTADGTAKIGDFGLAVATDRGRLTQAGLMVGTVSYMPPEQAIGGEVTPRSDLYSLGAMLYELVTGRPPFVGDESVAIITQHLNAPPVAPTWHNPEVPTGLDALVLRLLEKDPGKRPGTAADVRELLGAIALIIPFSKEDGAEAPPHLSRGQGLASSPLQQEEDRGEGRTLNPLYRRIFVGREHEVGQLQAAVDAALSGQGSLVMVVGEPGIGKTALCEQIATYAAVRGGRALVGHCYEEGSRTLPYLPFVEALRSYAMAREPDQLRQELASGAAEVARIVSEVRERARVEPPPPGDPEDDRWRLFQAVTGFLHNAAAVQPIVLVLEDLHWADRGTLDYLVHLSRNLANARLLVLGTYRDIEVDRAHPLSAALAELRRTMDLPRVLLRGLTPDEVHRMISGLTGQDVRWGLAESVHRQTEGNPLFIQEVLRYLVEEGLITREGGRWRRTGDGAPELQIPEGLRDVIGRRLSRLSPECNRLLTMAAVVGREFDLQTLRRVADVEEEVLLTALEEALRAAVLEEHSTVGTVRYRFTHALFQQTLYEEIIAPRRIRLHQQVGRAIEQVYARRLEDHAAELAEHFAHSSDPSDLEKAVEYGERAAQRAMAVFAYGEAARHLERCLQVQDVLDPDDKVKRCDLLLALGDALRPAGESLRTANEVASEAFALAEAIGDRRRTVRASLLALNALSDYGRLNIARTPEYREWVDRARAAAAPDSVDLVQADSHLARHCAGAGLEAEGAIACRRALELARRLGDNDGVFRSTDYMLILFLNGVDAVEERKHLVDELANWPQQGVSARTLAGSFWSRASVLLAHGERGRAEECWQQMAEIVHRTQDASRLLFPLHTAILLATMDGKLEDALATLRGLSGRAEELGVGAAAQDHLFATPLNAYLEREDLANIILSRQGRGLTIAIKALCLAHLGRQVEAQETLQQNVGESTPADAARIDRLTIWLETAVLLGDREMCTRILPQLGRASHLLLGQYWNQTCVARLLGAGAALLGDLDQARRFTEEAIEVTIRVRHRPEIALSRLQLAELLLDGDAEDQAVAAEHLDCAIEELRAMQMQSYLERALRHKGLLKA